VLLETLQEATRKTFTTSGHHDSTVERDVMLVSALVEHLFQCGARHAFGVSGGAIALLYDALVESRVNLYHFRHETGAAFAAAEAYFASQRPSLVFATTGPGILNSLTGLTAAKWDGAKVVLISGATSPAQRGRWATQETSSYTLPQDALYTKGPIFDFAVRMEHASELPEVARRLSLGLARAGGFLAHVCLPMALQSHRIELSSVPPPWPARTSPGAPSFCSKSPSPSGPVLAPRRALAWCASWSNAPARWCSPHREAKASCPRTTRSISA
jgi:acetolactate synthase I/II/III large subunit